MLKWLILGLVAALVSHWSSKEVQADTPLSEDEQSLLRQLRTELGRTSDVETRDFPIGFCIAQCDDTEDDDCLDDCLADMQEKREWDGSSCEEDCQYAADPDDCETECENTKRMLKEVRMQEEIKRGKFDSDSNVLKKAWGRRRGTRRGAVRNWWRRIDWDKWHEIAGILIRRKR